MISTKEIQNFLSSFEERVAPVEKAFGEAWWNLATTGTVEAQEEMVRAGNAYDALFADAAEFTKVKGWYGERESLESPLLQRQVEILTSPLIRSRVPDVVPSGERTVHEDRTEVPAAAGDEDGAHSA